jgi:hypothetical protein
LSLKGPLKIAIFGQAANEPVVAGGGSGAVFPTEVITPLQGIADAVGIKISNFESYSCNANYTKGVYISQVNFFLVMLSY